MDELASVKLLRKPNTRRSVVDEKAFGTLVGEAETDLQPILLVAWDTGMRLREILDLTWSQVNLKERVVRLAAEDTKTEEPRTIFLTSRVEEALQQVPRYIKSEYVFNNQRPPACRGRW